MEREFVHAAFRFRPSPRRCHKFPGLSGLDLVAQHMICALRCDAAVYRDLVYSVSW